MRWSLSFRLRKIPFWQQPAFDVLYKGEKVGLFIPDLIALDSIVVDTKVIDRITDHERGLMLNYLRITSLRVGACWSDSQFQTPQVGMGTNCLMNSCLFVVKK